MNCNCNCTETMDIRGRCCPFRDIKDFKNCNQRLNTALWHFENDYDIYKKLEKKFNNYDEIIKTYLYNINIIDLKDINKITKMYLLNRQQEQEDNEMINISYVEEDEQERRIIK